MGSDKGCKANYNVVSSPLTTEETISTKRRLTATLTTSPSVNVPVLPTIPFDLIPEILCRLSVKLLMQFRCVCKSWNSLITDSKFAKNLLSFATARLVHSLAKSSDPLHNYVIKTYPLDSVFSDLTTHVIAQLEYHPNDHYVSFVGSCNGIICLFKYYRGFPTLQLWNPSIRKFKELPPIENQQNLRPVLRMYGFGYDVDTNNYKVLVVAHLLDSSGNFVGKHKVMVYTLGSNAWKSIQKFPIYSVVHQRGKFVSGTINWLVYKESQHCIASFDLGNESSQEVSLPDFGEVYPYPFRLGVLGDCLCMVFGHDVWVMKEYGNTRSWTKLFTISYLPITYFIIDVVNIFEENQVLLKCREEYGTPKWIIYNSKNGTFEITQLENTLQVCVESLISPCC